MATCTCGSALPSQRRLSLPSVARTTLARNVASDTQTSDLVNSRRVTKWSSTHEMGKWSFQAGTSGTLAPFLFCWCARQGQGWGGRLLSGRHKRCDIDLKGRHAHWHHHLYLGLHNLRPEYKRVDRALPPQCLDFRTGPVGQGPAGAYCDAHGPLPSRGAVIAHVTLHHQVELRQVVRHTKGTRQHTVAAPDAVRRESSLHDPISRLLNGIRRADFSAGGILAVHADHRDRLWRRSPVSVLQVDHGHPAVRFAFGAGVVARLAADTARRIDKKLQSCLDHATAFSKRTAQTLNSGIFEIGSRARIVRRLAERSSGQW